MKSLFIAFIACLSFCNILSAQDKTLIVQGAAPNLYLVHKVAPKENYYSLGRLYNVPPKEIAPYNNLEFDKGLSLGQTIKIPLTQRNFFQGEAPQQDEVLIPVYHVMQAKEGLYRVSVNYNKVPADLLKQWNKLKSESVSNGTKLIVGYLKVDKEQSPLAKTDAVKNQVDMVVEKKEEKKLPEEPKKIPVKEKEQVVKNSDKEKVQEPIKEPVKEKPVEVKKPIENNALPASNSPVNFAGGYFKKMYNDQAANKSVVIEMGAAATFKTTSGWQDGKYYCFHNTAQPGTIIKITNNTNGKSVYAKVLDAIPDIKQNDGLLLRISNAAAEELGTGETKFDCSISYAK